MGPCELSVVVPAFNEARRVRPFIDGLRPELERCGRDWEIVFVDDGSTDRTAAVVEECAREDARIRLVPAAHAGKGAAVRRGLREAVGRWVFVADADLAMRPDNLHRFLAAADAATPPDIVIGTREGPGAERLNEPRRRQVAGRLFNWWVRALALPGLRDTQCGFKLFRAEALGGLLDLLAVDGFAFDVELLLCARRQGLRLHEVGIVWNGRNETGVRFGSGARAFLDVARIRWRARNRYASWAYALAAVLAVSFGADLFRMPIQVSDSLGEIVNAQDTPSLSAMFVDELHQTAYLRPLRRVQIKAVFDLSGGRYHLAYRGVHVALFVLALFLFVRALRVSSATDLAAAALATTVFLGLHTFYPAVEQAYPINHFLEMICFALLAFNLAQAHPGWTRDAAAMVVFAAAALTLESGLLVWAVTTAAWLVGLRGVSWRGVAGVTALMGAYLVVRFTVLATGAPGLDERSSGFLFETLEPDALQERFGASPLGFYAYNVVSSASSVLFAEPRAGVFEATRAWLDGSLRPWAVVAVVSSTLTTACIAAAAVTRVRSWRRLDADRQRIAVFGAVLAANSVLSYAYTKDDIVGVAGAFYALAAYAGVRVLATQGRAWRTWTTVTAGVLLVVAASGWAVRTAGLHHVLVSQGFKEREEWIELPALDVDTPEARALVRTLRADALGRPRVPPAFIPRWAGQWFEE